MLLSKYATFLGEPGPPGLGMPGEKGFQGSPGLQGSTGRFN